MNIIETNLEFNGTLTSRNQTTHCVFHHAVAGDSTVYQIHDYHKKNGWLGIAYHFYITKDGSVYRGRPLSKAGGHTTNWNYTSIGVCFQGNFEIEEMTVAQVIAGQELVEYLNSKYSNLIFVKHSDLNATACPGKKFLFDAIVYDRADSEPQESNSEDNTEAPTWAVEACEKAVSAGIIKGDGNGVYNWNEPLTLARQLVILDRLGLL